MPTGKVIASLQLLLEAHEIGKLFTLLFALRCLLAFLRLWYFPIRVQELVLYEWNSCQIQSQSELNFFERDFALLISHFSTIGPNSSKNGKERLQLYFHLSLVRHGTIKNYSQPGTMLVDCV